MENRIQPRDIYPIYKFDIELQFPLFFDIFLKKLHKSNCNPQKNP